MIKKNELIAFLFIVVAACNNPVKDTEVTQDTIPAQPAVPNNITLPGEMCFQYIVQRDTVTMQLFIHDSAVNGNLVYNMYEKDDNRGTFKGILKEEIIKAEYSYMSEGTTSVREVMFKLKDNILTEGYGDMEEVAGKFIFKDPAHVKFTQAFNKVDCK